MSPWTIYWVMQADSIKDLLVFFTATSCVSILAGVVGWFMSKDECIGDPDVNRLIGKWIKWLIPTAIVCSIGVTLFPSTKTLCAVIAVPAVVNNEQFQADAADIYRLGMERLKDELEVEKEEPQ